MSLIIAVFMACGTLPVHAEGDYGFTLAEKKVYLSPGSTGEVGYTMEEGHTAEFVFSSGTDLNLSFDGSSVTASAQTGIGVYKVLIDGEPTEHTVIFSVGSMPYTMYFPQSAYTCRTGDGTVSSNLYLEPEDSVYYSTEEHSETEEEDTE